jgi:PhnB protein
VDAVWEQALSAGAEVIFPLDDQFYGDRAGRIRDPFGHQWILSQRIRELSVADLTA